MHVHVQRDNAIGKFWIEPLRLDYGTGFKASELRRIERIISENSGVITEAWNEYFSQ